MVTVFSQKFCPRCDELKDLLNRNNISYEEKDVNEDHTAYAKMLMNDVEETPAAMVGDSFISGEISNMFNQIRELDK
jgi:glutaredoxin